MKKVMDVNFFGAFNTINALLPRRLILGKDAYKKVKTEADWLKKDLRNSKIRAWKCSKTNKDFWCKKIKKLFGFIK